MQKEEKEALLSAKPDADADTDITDDTDSGDDIDNNDDMLAKPEDINNDDSVSFSVSQSAAPQHSWTKSQMRAVWIIAVAAGIIIVLVGILLSAVDFDALLSGTGFNDKSSYESVNEWVE